MKTGWLTASGCVLILIALCGCATFQGRPVGPTPILQATGEIPEQQLMDVGIHVFTYEPLTAKTAEEEGASEGVRNAEKHFIPYHLKDTIQKSSHWGAVRVIPDKSASTDVRVLGKILSSNGENLKLEIEVMDSSGALWFRKRYRAEVSPAAYENLEPGAMDPFQDIYNTIANDIVRHRQGKLDPDGIKSVRTLSRLKFAREYAPDAFSDYLEEGAGEQLSIRRLPAEGDPMMARLLKIRDREYMFVDTLNEYYEQFYTGMWPSYENWRKLNLQEREAREAIRKEARLKQLGGILLIAGAVAMAASDVENTAGLQAGMVILGGKVFVDGMNVSKQKEMHSVAIKELSESFENEMKPIVIEFEGKQYELTGSAEEQFKKWRSLLLKIYLEETGFGPEPAP